MRKLVAIVVVLIAVLVPATATAAPSRTITMVNHTGQWPMYATPSGGEAARKG